MTYSMVPWVIDIVMAVLVAGISRIILGPQPTCCGFYLEECLILWRIELVIVAMVLLMGLVSKDFGRFHYWFGLAAAVYLVGLFLLNPVLAALCREHFGWAPWSSISAMVYHR